ncbi:MAG: ABC transporter substrate-binding protein [Flavobacterium sp.]|nr:MAG: ABC transporter substrate-binding protein [Flavobacterium sp.]
MKLNHFFFTGLLLMIFGCQQKNQVASVSSAVKNEIQYSKGLSIYEHKGYTIVKVSNPWPKADKNYTYVLRKKGAVVPDSLRSFVTIDVPVKKVIATSTTHIPSLEMLGVENTLIGFPHLDYISSEKVLANVKAGKVRELGSNQNMNTEVVIDLQPDVIIGYGIDNNNPTLDNLQRSGLKIMLNGDWNEQTPLGKAEWIKFFGALYGLENKADSIFSNIVKEYQAALKLAAKATSKPTVLTGGMFENKWNVAGGESWGALFIKDAGGNYLWSETRGTGSLSMPFEKVFERAHDANFWIGPGQFSSLKELSDSNPHYVKFRAFQDKNVFSFKTGKSGGVIYYELAPNRPDLVLKDVLKILHPELLPDYELFFFKRLE